MTPDIPFVSQPDHRGIDGAGARGEAATVTGVTEVMLSWPTRRNALGPDEANTLREALSSAGDSPECRVIILRAEGDVFCAGGDLRAVLEMVDGGEQALRTQLYTAFQSLLRAVRASPVPIIAAVEGPAIGLGADLALACQARVLSADTWISQGWTQLGLISAPGGLLDQARLSSALIWRFAGNPRLGARELGELTGDEVCDAPLERARAMAAHLAGVSRDVITTMRALEEIGEIEEHLAAALDHQVGFLLSPSFRKLAEERLSALKPTRD